MTVFNFRLRRGSPIVDQVVLAAIGAMLRGEYLPGHPFPSVRAIAADLKIHPNTALKVVQRLTDDEWLETQPGIGTIVRERSGNLGEEWRRLLEKDIDRLLRRARSIDIGLPDIIDALTTQWNDGSQEKKTEKL